MTLLDCITKMEHPKNTIKKVRKKFKTTSKDFIHLPVVEEKFHIRISNIKHKM